MPPKTNAPAKVAYRNRIVAMCQRFSPGTLPMVDQAMEHYAGNEEELIASLVAKFGPEPYTACDTFGFGSYIGDSETFFFGNVFFLDAKNFFREKF